MQEDCASKGAGKDDQPDTFILKPTKAEPSKASCIDQISVNDNSQYGVTGADAPTVG
jgi:hypothetical protein